jgi:hypothetical protein
MASPSAPSGFATKPDATSSRRGRLQTVGAADFNCPIRLRMSFHPSEPIRIRIERTVWRTIANTKRIIILGSGTLRAKANPTALPNRVS